METGRTVWLSGTGQRWKLVIFLLLMFMAGAALAAVIWMSQHEGADESAGPLVVCAVTGALGVLGAFLWLSLSVRCPVCRNRVAWSVLRTVSAGQWLVVLLSMEACPACGHAPEAAKGTPTRRSSGGR
jgi:hypothetical protein